MLNKPVLKATATDKPVNIKGVALNSMLPKFVPLKPKINLPFSFLPILNIPEKTSCIPSIAVLNDSFDPFTGINAIITSIRQPITKPKPIDIKDEEIDLTESFFHVFMNHVVRPSLIAFLDDKMMYVKNPAINTN